MVFVKEHAHLPWVTCRAERGIIDLGQRLNEVLESVENLWLYIQQLFEHDTELDAHIDRLEKEIEQLKLQCAVNYETNLMASKSDHRRFVHAYLQPSLGSVLYAHEKGQRHAPVRTAHTTQSVPMVCGPI